jgi:hypothetical protein
MTKPLKNWRLWLVASLTLGLAPFVPEPHLWGKIKWIAGGAVGMEPIDWADAIMHGLPWIGLIISGSTSIWGYFKTKQNPSAEG